MEIYAVRTVDIQEKGMDSLYQLISARKAKIIKRFLHKKDKINSIVGEILLRKIIIDKLNINNDKIVFGSGLHGKPYLENNHEFQFNISHSGDFVVCAFDDMDIGIDIEHAKSIEYIDIAKTFFSFSELNYIMRDEPNINRLHKFYDMWTLKESYIKCSGDGLSLELSSFSIEIDHNFNINIINDNKYKHCTFKRFNIDEKYKMAVCSLNKTICNNITLVDQNDLIENFLKFT